MVTVQEYLTTQVEEDQQAPDQCELCNGEQVSPWPDVSDTPSYRIRIN